MRYRVLIASLAATLLFAGRPQPAPADGLPGKSSAVGTVPHAALQTQRVAYRDGDRLLEGYLAYDAARGGTRPAVLLVHDALGLDAGIEQRAQRLARLGYVAFAADIYGQGVRPTGSAAAGELAGEYLQNRALFRARLLAAYRAMLQSRVADPARTAAIGYGLGGSGVLELASSGADLRGVVSFYGLLNGPPADGANLRSRVLILHGAEDPRIKPADLEAWLARLRSARLDWQMISYGGAGHGFADPAAGADAASAYDALAERRSWTATRQFLDELFAGEKGLPP